MKSALAISFFLLLGACSHEKTDPAMAQIGHDPISVRGWIADIDTGAPPGDFLTVETAAARRLQNFQSTNVWVENTPYVSGGVAETGSFILLDVPPHNITITFSAPGLPASHLVIQDAPPNCDILIPGLILKPNGVAIADPKQLRVRIAAKISKPAPTGMTARIAGIPVPVIQVPINAMVDRRDYPSAPAVISPVAKVK